MAQNDGGVSIGGSIAHRRRLLTAFALSAVIVAALAGCRRTPAVQQETLSIGFLHDPLASLLFVAEAEGFFHRQGLDVTFRAYEGGAYAIADMVAGTIDMAAATEYALVRSSLAQRDLKAIATIATADNVELLVRADRGILIPEDLRGRRIGVTPGMNTRYILGAYLAFNGMRFADINAVMLSPSQIVAALGEGTIDAGCIYPPFTDQAKESLGTGLLAWPCQMMQDYYYLLVTREAYTRQKPHVVTSLLRALLEAETRHRKDPENTDRLVGTALGIPPARVAEHRAQLGLRVSLSEDLLTLMEDEARWIVGEGLADAKDLPNAFTLVDYEPLERLKPEAVGIIH